MQWYAAMTRKRVALAATVVLLALAAWIAYLLTIAGEFRDLRPHFDGSCRLVPGAPGPEDIVILPDGSGAFISSHDRHAEANGQPGNGAIYYYDLNKTDAKPINVTPDVGADFRPHGIALFGQSLFVVSHPGADLSGDLVVDGPAHTIEVFAISGTTLAHRRTITDEALLISPNDIAPVSDDQFYVTNDHGSGGRFMRKVEDYLRIPRSHLLFYDGSGFTRLPGQYRYANGVATSHDGLQVYLAAVTDREVHVFARDPESNALTLESTVFVDTGPDNIDVDASGDLWIGSHPKLVTLAGFLAGRGTQSPSQVLRLDRDDGFGVEEVMLSDGSDLSASTVAARFGDRLLVGAVLSPGFLDCRMKR